jgi:hypothetical protein
MIGAVRNVFRRQIPHDRWHVLEVGQSDRDNYSLSPGRLIGSQPKLESRVPRLDGRHSCFLHIRNEVSLEVEAVTNEGVERHWQCIVAIGQTVVATITVKGEICRWVRKIGRATLGLQVHAGRHPGLPCAHWAPEDAEADLVCL